MLPWPTILPAYYERIVWSPTPAQQIECMNRGIGLQSAQSGWMATASGEWRTVRSWAEVVEFASAHGIKLKTV